MNSLESPPSQKRAWVARAFTVVEDVVYIGPGLLLAGSSVLLLVSGMISFAQSLVAGSFARHIVTLLDRILLILLFVELLYTVQVSFREHALVPEPFLLVGLIAAIRRVLVVTTAEFAASPGQDRVNVSALDRGTRRIDFPDRDARHFAIHLAKTRGEG